MSEDPPTDELEQEIERLERGADALLAATSVEVIEHGDAIFPRVWGQPQSLRDTLRDHR
jgi:hypothetical protein